MMDLLDQLDHARQWMSQALLILLCIPLGLTLYRLLSGPSHADRFVALDMLTGVAVTGAALAMGALGYREYLDVALGLAVFGFLGTCALAAFIERRGKQAC
ncbi:monovalent cation/H+ antiporter complex subunit F [Bordetella genomosp. 5]|nr:monovalent cation/H+ antiporter complex subunit F [Bordetella genomosp. 5]